MFRQYAQLTRAHTAPLEGVPAVAGAALARPSGGVLLLASWSVFGVLYHLYGYGMNSLVDWQVGFDQEDPNKQHHPLNSGSLEPETAQWMIRATGAVALGVTALLLLLESSVLAVVVVSIMVASGLSYNWLSKRLRLKFLPIAVAHSLVFATPYVALGGTLSSPLFLCGVAYVFLWVAFQIGVSGEVKDIKQDEENFLKSLGSSAKWYGLEFSREAVLFSYGVKMMGVALAIVIALLSEAALWHSTAVLGAGILSLGYTRTLIASGKYNREKRLKDMAVVELLAIVMLVMALGPVFSGVTEVFIVLGSIAWVMLFNLVEWGTVIAPQV